MFQVFVEVLVPVFLVVGAGFTVARIGGVTPRNLTTLAYWVLGPVFVFSVLADASLDAGTTLAIVAATALTMGVAGAITWGVARASDWEPSVRGASVLTSLYGNAGNFGLAITAFALGESALAVAGVVLVTINTGGIIMGVGLANAQDGSLGHAVRAAVTSPLALALIPALIVNLTNTDLPIWLDRPVGLVAAAMIPVMLLTLGIQIAGMPRRFPAGGIWLPIAVKLLAAPAVALLAVNLLGIGGLEADVVVLMAAMPAAVFTSLIALEHDLEPDYVTSIVLAGTLVSAATLPVVISLL